MHSIQYHLHPAKIWVWTCIYICFSLEICYFDYCGSVTVVPTYSGVMISCYAVPVSEVVKVAPFFGRLIVECH